MTGLSIPYPGCQRLDIDSAIFVIEHEKVPAPPHMGAVGWFEANVYFFRGKCAAHKEVLNGALYALPGTPEDSLMRETSAWLPPLLRAERTR